jgi:hypothetical protein
VPDNPAATPAALPAVGGRDLTVHVLRVTLLDVSPPVWRLVRVPSAATLSVVHGVLQVALGWEDRHLHEWRIEGVSYGPPDEEDWGDELEDEASVTLAGVAPLDSSFSYEYDLGDGWEHLVEVVSVESYDGRVRPVEVLDGARAVPPEDCGGPTGYEHLLDALADPDDEEHEELTLVFGDSLDPQHFDRQAINRLLEGYWRPAGA